MNARIGVGKHLLLVRLSDRETWVKEMHLGQTVAFLANALDIPEPTMKMVGRLMREKGYVKTGARGKNAPHMSYLEVARMIIASAVSESPAIGVERLPHYAALPLVGKNADPEKTFEIGLSRLLQHFAETDWAEVQPRMWNVEINMSFSWAAIQTSLLETEDNHPEMHMFSENVENIDSSKSWEDQIRLPFISPVERSVRITSTPLFLIAKAVGEGK